MEKFKLISMTDFVLNKKASHTQIVKYAKFLKQPLKLEMFVPCDEKNEPLDGFIHNINLTTMSEEWNKAKEKVLFEGIEEENNIIINRLKNGEKLIIDNLVKNVFDLTQNATKQFL